MVDLVKDAPWWNGRLAKSVMKEGMFLGRIRGKWEVHAQKEGRWVFLSVSKEGVPALYMEMERYGNAGSWQERHINASPDFRGSGVVQSVYRWLLMDIGLTLVSDDFHTLGGRSVWVRLAKSRGVHVYGWTGKEAFHVDEELEGSRRLYRDDAEREALRKDVRVILDEARQKRRLRLAAKRLGRKSALLCDENELREKAKNVFCDLSRADDENEEADGVVLVAVSEKKRGMKR